MKKTVSLLLAICLLMAGAVACQSPNPPAESPAAVESPEAPAPVESPETPAEPSEAATPAEEAPALPDTDDTGKTYKLGISISTLANAYFVAMKDAAEGYKDELGVEIIITDAQDNNETQLNQIQDMIMQEVDLMIVNAVDSDAIGTAVTECNNAGIPVITITRRANSGEFIQHLDTNNVDAGEAVGKQLVADMGGKGKLVILEGPAGVSSVVDRAEGFQKAIEGTEIEVLTTLSANYSRDEGAKVMEDILNSFPEIDVLFAQNDEMAMGALRSIEAANRLDQIKIYGIDSIADALQAIKDGKMNCTLRTNQEDMMRQAMDSAVAYLNGGELEELIYIPLTVVTADNVESTN